MARPTIGLTTYGEQAKFGTNDRFSAVLPMAYVHAVHASGGRAVLITQDDPDVDVLDGLDGIIFTGGPDIDPSRYGELPHPKTLSRPARDTAEMLLISAALAADLPTLAICRGMQLMAVAYGGRLFQHLPDVLGHDGHRPVDETTVGIHPVRFAPDSACHQILGASTMVNSRHHQGVADVGKLSPTGWVPGETPHRAANEDGADRGDPTDAGSSDAGVARADEDGADLGRGDELVEALENPTLRFAIGVQWHPEDTDDFRLFAALVEAAAKTRDLAPSRARQTEARVA